MAIFNTSNPFKSSSSSTQTSARRGPPRNYPPSSSSQSQSQRRQPPPPSPRLVSIDQLALLTSRLQELKSSFIQPPTLNFNSKSSTSEQPKLEYDKNNAPFHAYDEALTKLLIELDGIDSCGEEEIRLKRKGLVLEVERELERLDGVRKEEYKTQLGGGKREEGKEGETEKEGRRETLANGSQDQHSESRQPSNSAHSQPPLSNPSQPTFPPGLPLPPRDYPSTAQAQQSPYDYSTQYRNGLSSSSTKRPSSSSSESLQRPNQAHRGPPPPPASTTWQTNNPYRSQNQPPRYDDHEPRYAPQPQSQPGARYAMNGGDPYAAQGRDGQRRY